MAEEKKEFGFLSGFLSALFFIVCLGFVWSNAYMDDAFIGFRCIENFISGKGFFFNPGEPVEAVTNIGWLLFLTPFSFFLKTHLAGKLFGGLFLVFSAYLVAKAAKNYDRANNEGINDPHMRHILPILVFTSPTLLYYSHSGMETSFLCFMLLLPIFIAKTKYSFFLAALVYAASYAVRPECLLAFPVYIVCSFLISSNEQKEDKMLLKQFFGAALLWFSLIATLTFFRYAYFGDLLPNTFYAKATDPVAVMLRAGLFLSGKLPNLPLPFSGIFLLPVLFLGCHQIYKTTPEMFPGCFTASLLGWFFSIYAGTDWTLTPRYLAPYLPFCLMLIFAGLNNKTLLAVPSQKRFWQLFYVGCFFSFLVLNFINGWAWFGPQAGKVYPGYVINSASLLPAAHEIATLLPKNAVIATRRIGLIGYVTGCDIFDYKFSLPHKDVVKALNLAHAKYFDEPDSEFLAAIWKKRKPGFILEDGKTIREIIARQGGDLTAFEVHGFRFRHLKSFKIGSAEKWMLYALSED